MTTPTIHILYENPDWMPPLEEALDATDLPYRKVFVDQGVVGGEPEPGIYLNRMSPSAHTRGHERGVELTRDILAWLEAHDRRVVNGLSAYELEMSKFRQYQALRAHGIRTPRTKLAVGAESLVEAAGDFDGAFITKHNRGGKGLGIELFEDDDQLEARLDAGDFDMGPHGQVLIQQYIEPASGFITRVELVGGEMILAMRSSTDDGFELCPSDACRVPDNNQAEETSGSSETFAPSPLTADDPLVGRYRALCADESIEIAGIEFVEDAEGHRYTYDINSTTNYNRRLGEEIGVRGMYKQAEYLRNVVVPQVTSAG
jgi:glutathione synthase/RimK-type ligase-like ATP-grasp enzyme